MSVPAAFTARSEATRVLPAPDHQPAVSWLAASIRSRCPHPEVACPARLDVFWDGLWSRSSNLAWMTAATVDAQQAAGLVKLPHRLSTPPADAVRQVTRHGKGWGERLRVLAAVDMWRTLSAEQVAAVTGDLRVLDVERSVIAAPFRAGLIDIGTFDSPARVSRLPKPRTTVYRPARTKVFDTVLGPRLTFPEWVAVTGGQPWSATSQFDRHNLLAAELGLRLLEYADVATVLGEKLSSLELLAGSGLGTTLPHADNRAADLTVIRPDGLRVAVELTAGATGRFRTKVERWCRLLAEQPVQESGLMVLFVVADPVERHGGGGKTCRNTVATIIKQFVNQHPGWAGNRVAERIGITDWQELFPARHRLAQHFFDLRCLVPAGPPDRPWVERRWLARNPQTGEYLVPFAPRRDRSDFTAVADNVQGLAGIPQWARNPHRGIKMWQLMLAERGHDHFPIAPSPRPDRLTGAPFGSVSRAIGGPPQPPKRLQGL